MFRQDDYYIIKDGVQALAISNDNQTSWTIDLRQVYRFASLQEAESYCVTYIKTRNLMGDVPSVKRLNAQYIVP